RSRCSPPSTGWTACTTGSATARRCTTRTAAWSPWSTCRPPGATPTPSPSPWSPPPPAPPSTTRAPPVPPPPGTPPPPRARPVSLGELHARLYGDRPVTIATLKAEISRLRRELQGQLTSRPYRLTVDWEADVTRLLARLDQGDVEGAARLYDGQLLPASTSPFVEEHRHHVDVALRTAVLQRPSAAVAVRYNAVHTYAVEVLERVRSGVPDDDPMVPALTGRLAAAGF